MATIEVRREHGLGLDTAKERAEALAKEMVDRFGVEWRWDGDRIRFEASSGKAKGVKGVVLVSGRDVRVEIDLPFLLRAMKGMIAGKVDAKLDKLLV
jgi:putative polyhydroxyalkanoate system protein